MTRPSSLRRVLIVADESADWMVAGLRQLDRLALSIDEFAVVNSETAPVLVCIFWRPDLDQSQRWIPNNPRLTKVAFATDLDDQPYDLILSTRLFVYRNAVRQLLEASGGPTAIDGSSWDACFRLAESLPQYQYGAWEYISDGEEIDRIEKNFLRGSGKSQDGFVSKYLNRPVSRTVTRLLLRFPTTPNTWTWLIFPIPVVAALVLAGGTYGSFLWGLVLFQVFSVLDGCDGEIARAKFSESERGRRLDDLCDILSNILLVTGLGFGLFEQARFAGHSGWFYVIEGISAAVLIGANEWYLATRKLSAPDETKPDLLGDTLYPRHRDLVERSGMLVFGEKFASSVIQLTKRDVAVLFFVFLAAIGLPALILHLQLVVTAASLALALRSR
jgi:CDP-alcohol phosphatidyltransferase-like enzyme